MIDIQKISSFTPGEVLATCEFQRLEDEANELEALIPETYCCFGIKEKKIVVLTNFYSQQILTYDGKWQLIRGKLDYSLECSKEKILEILKTQYLMECGYISEDDRNYDMKIIINEFQVFINKTKKMAREQKCGK